MLRLETSRLLLRRWTQNDMVPMSEINADPEVMRWIGGGSTRTTDETKDFISRCEEMWETQGFGLFAVEIRQTSELAGFVGLAIPMFLPEVMPAVEIGWRLARSCWGKGIATEAAKEALRFGFEDCDLNEIISIFQIGNSASERIMQKLGMYLKQETIDPSCGRRVRVYAAVAPSLRNVP